MRRFVPLASIISSLIFGLAYLKWAGPEYNEVIVTAIIAAISGSGVGEIYRRVKKDKHETANS